MFVHTDIVILTKFVSTLVESACLLKAQFFVELYRARVGQHHQSVSPVGFRFGR